MMRRAVAAWVAAVGLLATAGAQETTDKQQLQYSWKKGDKFALVSKYAMSVKLDKVPEALQGVLSDEPAALKLEANLDVEVKEVAENGTATLEGQWKTLTAKGHVMVNDVDFSYDAAKKTDKPEKKPEAGGADGLPGLPNLEDTFRHAVQQPVKIQVDRRGRMKVETGGKSREGMDWLFYSMNGLMGSLPAEKVGRGDKWKDEFKPSLPGAGAILDVKSAVESTIVGEENACLVIQSKFTVGGGGEKKDGDPSLAFKMKASGEGEGKTLFDPKAGRLSKCQHALKSRVEAEIPNPGGGDAIDLKATVKIDQSNEIGK
jgi:hypothetical protein